MQPFAKRSAGRCTAPERCNFSEIGRYGSLVRPILWLMLIMALSAFVAGISGWLLASNGAVILVGRLATAVPPERHVPFIAALWAHSASYLVGFVAGVVVMVLVWRERGRRGGSNQ